MAVAQLYGTPEVPYNLSWDRVQVYSEDLKQAKGLTHSSPGHSPGGYGQSEDCARKGQLIKPCARELGLQPATSYQSATHGVAVGCYEYTLSRAINSSEHDWTPS